MADETEPHVVRVVNVTRMNCLPGAGPFDFDDAVVLSETETELHIITKKPQPKCLFRGTLVDAHAFVRANGYVRK